MAEEGDQATRGDTESATAGNGETAKHEAGNDLGQRRRGLGTCPRTPSSCWLRCPPRHVDPFPGPFGRPCCGQGGFQGAKGSLRDKEAAQREDPQRGRLHESPPGLGSL